MNPEKPDFITGAAEVQALLSRHPEWVSAHGHVDDMWLRIFLTRGGTPEEAAALIWAHVEAQPFELVTDKVWKSFGPGGHSFGVETSVALGLQEPDVVPESVPPARTAADAIALAQKGWHYSGDARFLDLSTEGGRAAFAVREARAKNPPPELAGIGFDLVWYLFVSDRLSTVNPKNLRGFDLQKFLDNEWAARDGAVLPWAPGGGRA